MTNFPSQAYLDERDIPYERKSFPPETKKGAANVARVLGFSERQAVKTLIFESDTGEKVLEMPGGDQSAISGHLKKAIGSRDIKFGSLPSGPVRARFAVPRAGTALSPPDGTARLAQTIFGR